MINSILKIGVKESESLKQIKIKKLFNGLTFVGIFISVLHFFNFYQYDILAGVLHLFWGCICIIGLWLNYKSKYFLAKVIVSFGTIIAGHLAAVRIGAEVYPHFYSFGIIVAAFIFFNEKKDLIYWIIIVLISSVFFYIIEMGWYKSESIQFENPEILRFMSLTSTVVFVAFEVLFLVRLSQINENKITEQLKESNNRLQEMNDHKTVLIQEIHHRVKNNLQVIISLIKLHANEISDEKALRMIDNFKRRLHSISIMHEMMYTTQDVGTINFDKFVNKLVKNLMLSQQSDFPVEVKVDADNSKFKNAAIVPLALILHELISNSLQHAFKEKNEGRIFISLRKDKNHFKLTYADDGIWTKSDIQSFGSELIELLTQQLSGEIIKRPVSYKTEYVILLDLD